MKVTLCSTGLSLLWCHCPASSHLQSQSGKKSPDSRLPQLHAGGQGPYLRSLYSTRIEELIDSREAISGKRLGFMMKFFTTKCTYRCTILFKVLEPFRWIHFFFCKNFFFSFLTILTRKITPKKIPLRCMLVRHIYTNFFFCWRFSANFCAYGTQNSKNTKSGISH